MKIDRVSKADSLVGTAKPADRAGSANAASGSGQVASAAVQLTGASQLQQLRTDLGNKPAFDAARVEQIKQAIQSGQFTVHPEAVADGLINSVRDLLQSRS